MVTDEWEQLHTNRTKSSSRTKTDDAIGVDGEGPGRKRPFKKKRKCYECYNTESKDRHLGLGLGP